MNFRVKFVIFFVIFFVVILLNRVYYISIKSNHYYTNLAEQNIIKEESIAGSRGIISDSRGNPLVKNRHGFSIFLKPALRYKKNRDKLNEVSIYLEKTFDSNKTKIIKKYLKSDSHYNHDFIKVIDFIPYSDVLKVITKLNINPLIKLKVAFQREYPYGKVASHILGYVSRANKKDLKIHKSDVVGKSGLEKSYNKVLQGKLGFTKIKVNAKNETIETIEHIEPIRSNITTSIDIELQTYITKLFNDSELSGVAIVMDVDNGEVLAAGSFPELDVNSFVNGISVKEWKKLSEDFNHPFTNKITRGLYPPGSVIKMGIAFSFMDSNEISEHTKFNCTGTLKLGKHNRKFRCWSRWGHHKTSLIKAIRESCDIYFYEGSLKVGINNISNKLRKYGFGKQTGIDMPNEFIGTIPNKDWKRKKYKQSWYIGETLISSIGQGYMLVTPLQVARYTALLASKKLVTPHFVTKIDDNKTSYKTTYPFTKADLKILPKIKRAMYQVCNDKRGTATKYMDTNVTIACKTGTAQVVGIPQSEKKRMKEDELKYFHKSHAWMTTYGPYKKPKYVVTVLIEHGGHGGHAAGPTVSRIYNWLKDKKYF